MSKTIVFIHGWSVTNINTYGELPVRLQAEGEENNLEINVKQIFLGRYISFHDEVGVDDISRAFDTAIREELAGVSDFVCITHSTGGPVVRDWWNRYYGKGNPRVSHLIMLAPANFGSALAKLGKSKLSRINSFFHGIEPGQRVLDWLQLGSIAAWELNKKWILSDGSQMGPNGIFPFVITGQYIDRTFYDNLNSYTGEIGSDGVVRTAAANLNSRYIKLLQKVIPDSSGAISVAKNFEEIEYKDSPRVPLRVVAAKSHSGEEMGVMRSVKKSPNDIKSAETVAAIIDCIKVTTNDDYDSLFAKFDAATADVQKRERIELVTGGFFSSNREFIHDRYSQVIFRVTDSEGYPVTDFDIILTADNNNPNHLPEGFAADRQQNSSNPEIITYFLNYDIMMKINNLGLRIDPRPLEGFVRFVPCEIDATKELLNIALQPNSTTMLDIILHRVVSKNVFTLEKLPDGVMPSEEDGRFDRMKPGNGITS